MAAIAEQIFGAVRHALQRTAQTPDFEVPIDLAAPRMACSTRGSASALYRGPSFSSRAPKARVNSWAENSRAFSFAFSSRDGREEDVVGEFRHGAPQALNWKAGSAAVGAVNPASAAAASRLRSWAACEFLLGRGRLRRGRAREIRSARRPPRKPMPQPVRAG